MNNPKRLYVFDNIKTFLIILVVFGHILELITSRLGDMAYTFIYMFHMPMFVFCSGYFAKFNPMKILTRLAVPYLIFQLVYTLFGMIILGNTGLVIQFTTPFWILWFLFALIVWMLLLPIIDALTDTKLRAAAVVAASFVLGILAGFEDTMGYYMSLQRIFYFLPFFVSGYCVKKWVDPDVFVQFFRMRRTRIVFGVLTAGIAAFVFLFNDMIYVRWLWAAFSYERLAHTGYTFVIRILLYLAAIIISAAVISFIPLGKLFFSYVGERTLQVFLLHGFVVFIFDMLRIDYFFSGFVILGIVLLTTLFIVFAFSSRLFSVSFWPGLFFMKGGTK